MHAYSPRAAIFAHCIALCVVCISTTNGFGQPPRTKRLPVPEEEAQKAALVLVREVFEDQSSKATTPAEKSAVAKRMIQTAADSTNDASTRFVLLRVARDIAGAAGDAQLVLDAVDQLAKYFDIDAMEMKVQRLMKVAKSKQRLNERRAFITIARKVLDEAVAVERFELAVPFAEALLAAARTTGDTRLVKEMVARSRDFDALVKAFEPIQRALERLESDPIDPEANLIVGRYRCLVRGEWSVGLPYLALSSDAELKHIAEQELKEPTMAEGQVKLGDAWWDAAKNTDGQTKIQIRRRAAHWYRLALADLTGLKRAKVDQRLAAVPKSQKDNTAATKKPDRDNPNKPSSKKLGMVVNLAKNCQVVVNQQSGGNGAASRAVDGSYAVADGDYWFPGSRAPAPDHLKVQLQKLSRIQAIRMLIPIGTKRFGDGHEPLDYQIVVEKDNKRSIVATIRNGNHPHAARNGTTSTQFVIIKLRQPVDAEKVDFVCYRTSGRNYAPVVFEFEVIGASYQ
jgi:hypothetical protein